MSFTSNAIIGFVSLVAAVGVMPLARNLGMRTGMTDTPGTRKIHTRLAVRSGGIGVGAAFLVGAAIGLSQGIDSGQLGSTRLIWGLLVLGIPVLVVGSWDDMFGLSPAIRLVVQGLAAAAFLYILREDLNQYAEAAGVSWQVVAGVAWFVILAGINAMNMIDGIDGLAGGLAGISLLGLTVMLGLDSPYAVAPLAVIGAILGFLPWNIRGSQRGRLFLGDGGSTLLGALVSGAAVFAVVHGGGESTRALWLDFAIVVGAIGLPLIDEGVAVVRRLLMFRSPLAADQSHIHHLVVFANSKAPKPARRALYFLSAVQVVIAAATALAYFSGKAAAVAAVLAVGLMVLALYARLGVVSWRYLKVGWRMQPYLRRMIKSPNSDEEAKHNVDTLIKTVRCAGFISARILDQATGRHYGLYTGGQPPVEIDLPIPAATTTRPNDLLQIGMERRLLRDYALAALVSPVLPSLRRARIVLSATLQTERIFRRHYNTTRRQFSAGMLEDPSTPRGFGAANPSEGPAAEPTESTSGNGNARPGVDHRPSTS